MGFTFSSGGNTHTYVSICNRHCIWPAVSRILPSATYYLSTPVYNEVPAKCYSFLGSMSSGLEALSQRFNTERKGDGTTPLKKEHVPYTMVKGTTFRSITLKTNDLLGYPGLARSDMTIMVIKIPSTVLICSGSKQYSLLYFLF